MERIQSINPQRIEWCCTDHGITPSALAAEVGIKPERMDKLMAGEDGIVFNQLDSIAKYFGRGALFFLEPTPVDEAQLRTTAFRTLANQKPEMSPKLKMLIERVERQRDVYMGLREDLEDIEHPIFSPPTLDKQNLKEAARLTRQWLGLGEHNNFDSYREALEEKNILVFRSNGYAGNWKVEQKTRILGFALYDLICPVIVVTKQTADTQLAFTLMHELGHLLLHKSSSIDHEDDFYSHQKMEQEANAFAGHLLVPEHFLSSINDAERPDEVSQYDDWLKRLRKLWGISSEVILRRLLDSDRLTKNQYAAYRAWRSDPLNAPKKTEGHPTRHRHNEPKHIFGKAYVRTVFGALNAEHITVVRASRDLDGLKISDLRKLGDSLAGV